ncbi:MAG: dTDP-4-dehydrorhamnose 3,5-epimerase family protein [Caldimonas sp.]
MKLQATPIVGLWEVETAPHRDERGSLTRLFCAEAFAATGPDLRFVQVNHSVTRRRGTIRGLHFQRPPASEWKLIRCLRGRVFDVAVDLREASPTFARWHAVLLGADNQRQILIPPGCAHGFQTLDDDAELLYQHTAPYTPALEDGVRHDDPRLAIAWPEPATGLSPRDLGFRPLDATFEGLRA